MPPGTSGPPEGEASQEGCGDMKGTRLRDHSKWDLALAAVTLSVTAVAAGSEVTRWVSGRFRGHHGFSAPSTMSKRPPSS